DGRADYGLTLAERAERLVHGVVARAAQLHRDGPDTRAAGELGVRVEARPRAVASHEPAAERKRVAGALLHGVERQRVDPVAVLAEPRLEVRPLALALGVAHRGGHEGIAEH